MKNKSLLIAAILVSVSNVVFAGAPSEDPLVADLANKFSKAHAPTMNDAIEGQYKCYGMSAYHGVFEKPGSGTYNELKKFDGIMESRYSEYAGQIGGAPDALLVFTERGLVSTFINEAGNGTQYIYTLYHKIGQNGELIIQRTKRFGEVVKEGSREAQAKLVNAIDPIFQDEKMDCMFLCVRLENGK